MSITSAAKTPTEQQHGLLDLEARANRECLKFINWAQVKRALAYREKIFSPYEAPEYAFLEAVCTQDNCPIGWEGCRGYRPVDCWFYALVKTAITLGKVEELCR